MAGWLQLEGSFASSYFAPCEFESKFCINDDFSTNLCDGSIDFSALLDAIGGGQTATEEASESSKPIDKVFLFFGGSFLVTSPSSCVFPCCARNRSSSPVIYHTGLPSNSCSVIAYNCFLCIDGALFFMMFFEPSRFLLKGSDTAKVWASLMTYNT